jgi:hypothetical protein
VAKIFFVLLAVTGACMSSAFSKILMDVRSHINRRILDEAFKPQLAYKIGSTSIDDNIISKVIRPRVMVDLNIMGGVEVIVDLNDLTSEIINLTDLVFVIPKAKTQNRSIISPLSVSFLTSRMPGAWFGGTGYTTTGILNTRDNSAVTSAIAGIVSSFDKIPVTATADVELIGENTIIVKNIPGQLMNMYLRCLVGNDDNLANVPLKALMLLGKIAVAAVKAHVYLVLQEKIAMGKLEYGQEFSYIKDVVDQYADANDTYNDLLEKWKTVAFMMDTTSMSRYITGMVPAHS